MRSPIRLYNIVQFEFNSMGDERARPHLKINENSAVLLILFAINAINDISSANCHIVRICTGRL